MPIYLADVIRASCGWPISLRDAEAILKAADELLAPDGGRQCRRALTGKELEHFGVFAHDIPPREPVDRNMPLRLSADLHRRIRQCADQAGLSISLWTTDALRAAVEAQERAAE